MEFLLLTSLVSILSTVLADYACLCSYATDTPLYDKPTTTSNVIGHLYEFDCKPEYTGDTSLTADWKAVMINHHIGYFKASTAVSSEICQGSIPKEDKVTIGSSTTSTVATSTGASTSLSTSTVITRPSSTITPSPKTLNANASSPLIKQMTTTRTSPGFTAISSTQPSNSISLNPVSTARLPQTTNKPVSASFSTAKLKPQIYTSSQKVPSPSTTKITTIPSTVTHPTSTQRITTIKQTSPGRKPSSTTHKSQPHLVTPKVTSGPVLTQQPKLTYKCPDNVLRAAVHNHGRTRVYGNTCYELVPYNYQWFDAEANCKNKGGHLVHIQNIVEENNVMKFLYDNNFRHAIWIGLTDLHQENFFYWTSGDPVTFTKWAPGHINNFDNHHYEDCVVLVPYIKAGFLGSHGLWDDIHCNAGHPWVCQYYAEPVQSLSGHIFGNGGNGGINFNFGHQGSGQNHLVFTTKTPVVGGLGHVLDIIGR